MTLRDRLIRYLRNQHGFISSGQLQRLVVEKTSYTPANCSRRLRELAAEGILTVQIRKGHAWYSTKQETPTLF